jgi:hypothetical protein
VVIVPDTTPATGAANTASIPATAQSIVQPKPAATETAVIPALIYPESLILASALEKPDIGTGINDRIQSLGFRAADLDPLPVTGIRLLFFAGQDYKAFQPGTPATPAGMTAYRNNTLGTLTALPGTRNNRPGLALNWKPAGDSGTGTEILFVAFDRSKPGIEMQWHANALLRNPVFDYIYWTLQNSALALDSPRTPRQQIAMKPFVPPVVNFVDALVTLPWPTALPRDVRVVEPPMDTLPPGWKADWFMDWDPKIAPGSRTTDNADQVLSFKKATNSPQVDAWFLLTFKPAGGSGLGRMESTFARRYQQDQDDLARAEKDLADINKKIGDIDPVALKTLGSGTLPQDLTARLSALQRQVDAYKAAVAGYNELNAFDVTFNLTDNMRLATLHLQRPKAFETGK